MLLSHNQYCDLVILPFLVNGMSLLCKPSNFPFLEFSPKSHSYEVSFLEFYQKSPLQKIFFFGKIFIKKLPFWKVT